MSTINPGPVPDPVVFPPYVVRRFIEGARRNLISPTFRNYLNQRLPSLPPWFSSLLLLLLALNVKSFPGLWHLRVFLPAFYARLAARPSIHPLLPWIGSKKHATTSPGAAPLMRIDALPLGKDIFSHKTIYTHRLLFDDADFNMHMSNSSYAKNTDSCRIAHLTKHFLRMHFDGGWLALGAQTLVYHREIPLFAKYEVVMSVVSWDSKWLYMSAKFVSPATRKERTRMLAGKNGHISRRSKSVQSLKALLKDVAQPQGRPPITAASLAKEAEEAAAGEAEGEKEEDLSSRTLYCTVVSRCCFKSGRKTIPPWFIVATSGYGAYASTRSNWERAESLRREVQSRAAEKHKQEKGTALPRDGYLNEGSHRQFGLLTLYDPSRPEGAGKEDERGLGAWQDKSSWHLSEFEERRLKGLEELKELGALLPSPSTKFSISE